MADGTLKVGTITNSAGSGNIAIGSGVTLLSNVPAFEATMSANQGLTSGATTKVEFDTETFDTDGMYDHSTNYRFTPTVVGKYFFFSSFRLVLNSDSFLLLFPADIADSAEDATVFVANDVTFAAPFAPILVASYKTGVACLTTTEVP